MPKGPQGRLRARGRELSTADRRTPPHLAESQDGRPRPPIPAPGVRHETALAPARAHVIPAGRTADGSPERLRRFGGILLGDAAVPAPLSIRTDRDPAELRRLARRE